VCLILCVTSDAHIAHSILHTDFPLFLALLPPPYKHTPFALISTVFKTKAATETAKRLEGNLEDAFGSANTRDFRGQKKGGAKGGAPNNKTNQQKTDQRRSARIKLEKQLQTNMESFVTRSILDPELNFIAPIDGDPENVVWPIRYACV
jgi:hypothetical protein